MFKRAFNACIRLVRKIPFVDKKWELWVYIFFGGLTTVFSWLIYLLFALLVFPSIVPDTAAPEGFLSFFFGGDNLVQTLAQAVSWVLSVAFAFFTNRAFVFKDNGRGTLLIAKLCSFYLSRLFTGLVFEILGFALINAAIHAANPDFDPTGIIAKATTSVAVVVVNYFFSKFLIFRKKRKQPQSEAESSPDNE